jgi:hypothetical protein
MLEIFMLQDSGEFQMAASFVFVINQSVRVRFQDENTFFKPYAFGYHSKSSKHIFKDGADFQKVTLILQVVVFSSNFYPIRQTGVSWACVSRIFFKQF